jgi:hypothetical protein
MAGSFFCDFTPDNSDKLIDKLTFFLLYAEIITKGGKE